MTSQLSLFARAFDKTGAVVHDNGFDLSKANDEQLSSVGRLLQSMTHYQWWGWGDYMLTLFNRQLNNPQRTAPHRAHEAKHNPRLLIRMQCQFLAEYVMVSGQDFDQLRRSLLLAEFYPLGQRVDDLSPQHHHEARIESGDDLSVALEWLHKAKKEQWSAKELRKEMATALNHGVLTDGDEPMPTLRVAELTACARWAMVEMKRVKAGDVTQGDAAMLLREMGPVLTLATKLQQLAASTDGNGA